MMQIEPPPREGAKKTIYGWMDWPPICADAATHEASHLVTARALGLTVHDAVTNKANNTGKAGIFGPVIEPLGDEPPPADAVASVFLRCASNVFPGLSEKDAAINFAIISVSGRMGELMAAGAKTTGTLQLNDRDYREARAVLLQTDQRLALHFCELMARHLLSSAWPEVEAIAAKLRKSGTWASPAAWGRQSRIPTTT